ncbi:MAG: hypothetical protein LAN59_09145 [Acidobacteriia bacterium]|nr:hypothetical protein [Terriglobia bacterium]
MPTKHKKPEVPSHLVVLDAKTFQPQLDQLVDTLAYKVQREGLAKLPKPAFVTADIYMLMRQAHRSYDLFLYLNSDERRSKDPDWRIAYSIVILPILRCMIDCLYNVTSILKSPGPKGYQFRESGYKLALRALDDDEQRYGGDPKWDSYIAEKRRLITVAMKTNGITSADIKAVKTWPTLGAYLRVDKNNPDTPHKQFLRTLTFGFWQEYSGMAHATFQGLLPTAFFYAPKDVPHEYRPVLDDTGEGMIFLSVSRAAAILLCLLTEVQAYFRFDGARINERLHQVWNALIVVPEIKELYDKRYATLMTKKGINTR